MKILFINPPVRIQEPAKHIPWGIAMLASIAESLGHDVAVLDLNAFRLGMNAIRHEISGEKWDIIGIGGLSSQYKYIKQILPELRKLFPDALILGGEVFSHPFPKIQ